MSSRPRPTKKGSSASAKDQQARAKKREKAAKQRQRRMKLDTKRAEKDKEFLFDKAQEEWANVSSKFVFPHVHRAHHAQTHRPIFSLGKVNLHHLKKDKRWTQHHYAFVPSYKQLMDEEVPASSRNLSYIHSSQNERQKDTAEDKKIFYVTKDKLAGKTHASQEEIDDLFKHLRKKGGSDQDNINNVVEATLQRHTSSKNKADVAECHICMTTDFTDPWISRCEHICCSDCWTTWLKENNPAQCPSAKCDKPISQEDLQALDLCVLCNREPTDLHRSSCGHIACYKCWRREIDGGMTECPKCGEGVSMTDILNNKQSTPRKSSNKSNKTGLLMLGGGAKSAPTEDVSDEDDEDA